MKTIKLFSKNISLFLTMFCLLIISKTTFSQSAPELVFNNPVLESGADKQDGAKYRFSNVTTGVDAVLEIKGRSSAAVLINDIDITNVGWGNAWQPELGKSGTVYSGDNWWVQFGITFYNTGTNNRVIIDKMVVTGINIDGDNQSLHEFVLMDSVCKYVYSPNTILSQQVMNTYTDPSLPGEILTDIKVEGPVTKFAGIDTSATSIMVNYTFLKKSEINFKLGAANGSGNTTDGMRLNSLWFKELNIAAHTLPVSLYSFNTLLDKESVRLQWSTASEQNLSHFNIERSTDGKNFSDIALVFAYGNSSDKKQYSYSDNISNLSGKIIYYRLKMQDIDGKFTYSDISVIRKADDINRANIYAYPNPVVSELRITVPGEWQDKKIMYEIFNAAGKRVLYLQKEKAGQTETVSMAGMRSGLYIIKVSSDKEIIEKKIIKH